MKAGTMNRFFNKIITKLIPVFILIPCVLCAILASKVNLLEKRIDGRNAYEELGERETRLVQLSWYDQNAYVPETTVQVTDAGNVQPSGRQVSGEEDFDVPDSEGGGVYDSYLVDGINYASDTASDGIHRVYLTFDDGPSIYTDDILDILAEYDVKATFFVIGRENTASYARYIRIVEEGHTLGMHSFTHIYNEVYASPESFAADTERIRSLLEDVTGVTPVFYRFPGGSSNTVSPTDMHELAQYLDSQGIVYFDWNVSSGDAGKTPLTSDQIIRNALNGIESRDTTVILFHDTAAKRSTVYALPAIIEALQSMENVEILPITADTPVVQHVGL